MEKLPIKIPAIFEGNRDDGRVVFRKTGHIIWLSACLNLIPATLSLLNPLHHVRTSNIYRQDGDQVKLKKPSKKNPSVQEEFQYM